MPRHHQLFHRVTDTYLLDKPIRRWNSFQPLTPPHCRPYIFPCPAAQSPMPSRRPRSTEELPPTSHLPPGCTSQPTNSVMHAYRRSAPNSLYFPDSAPMIHLEIWRLKQMGLASCKIYSTHLRLKRKHGVGKCVAQPAVVTLCPD